MQYSQRRLHRSVTESRRLRSGRPKASFIRIEHCKPEAARDEGPRGDLSAEFSAPPARDRSGTGGASAVLREPVLANVIAVAGDERLAARRAPGLFQVADRAGQVAGIDVPQPVRPADVRCGE